VKCIDGLLGDVMKSTRVFCLLLFCFVAVNNLPALALVIESGKCLKSVQGVCQSSKTLTSLTINGCVVTPELLAGLSEYVGLEMLFMAGVKLSGNVDPVHAQRALDYSLAALKKLKMLDIRNNDWLTELNAQMPALEYLALQGSGFDKYCDIFSCPRLKRLNISGTELAETVQEEKYLNALVQTAAMESKGKKDARKLVKEMEKFLRAKDLVSVKLDEKGWKALCSRVKKGRLAEGDVTEEKLSMLVRYGAMRKVKNLFLCVVIVDQDGREKRLENRALKTLPALSHLTGLRGIDISGTGIECIRLGELPYNLYSFKADGCKFVANGLDGLRGCKRLRWLFLREINFSGGTQEKNNEALLSLSLPNSLELLDLSNNSWLTHFKSGWVPSGVKNLDLHDTGLDSVEGVALSLALEFFDIRMTPLAKRFAPKDIKECKGKFWEGIETREISSIYKRRKGLLEYQTQSSATQFGQYRWPGYVLLACLRDEEIRKVFDTGTWESFSDHLARVKEAIKLKVTKSKYLVSSDPLEDALGLLKEKLLSLAGVLVGVKE
jgi:Leucine-rich repeat (LRR) protein